MSDPSVWWKTAVLGVLQGATEFLPISSSGHLIAFKEILSFQQAPLAFDVALHVATIAAVLIYFRADLVRIWRHARRASIVTSVILAAVPGALLGACIADWRETVGPWWVVGGWTFSACYLVLSKGRGGATPYTEVSPRQSLVIGSAQALAIFPGVSRSGSSIVSGLWLGLDRDAACRFSFLTSIPLVAGAGLKKALDLTSAEIELSGGWPPILLGMLCAFVVGMLAIHALLGVVRGDNIHRFGWYNLSAAILFAIFLATR